MMSGVVRSKSVVAIVRLAGPRLVAAVAAVAGGLTLGFLVASGFWYVGAALLLAVPLFIVLYRYPLATVILWLFALPLVGETSSYAVRAVFWLVHRGLPPAALASIVLARMLCLGNTKRVRLGGAEVMMGTYLLISFVSIVYTAPEFLTTLFVLYDRVFIPMCLYLIIRLVEPDDKDLRRLLPVVLFVLVSQSVLGIISWRAPHVLPEDWLGKVGERTTGSLRAPEVFGATAIFCGAFILHVGMRSQNARRRMLGVLLFVAALIMVFLSFSRSVWLAGFTLLVGTMFAYRGLAKRVLLVAAPLLLLLLGTGLLAEQTGFAQERFRSAESEESALSRLPVFYAAVRMFEARPLTGWGYETFDRFDRQFQQTVGNLVAPDKDHASHNLWLTTLAEQGILGFALFLGPHVYWLVRTRSRATRMPTDGFVNRKFVTSLWIVFLCFVLINNFYRMQTPFALGMWWLTAGLIATAVGRNSLARSTAPIAPKASAAGRLRLEEVSALP